jgi:hypothetical protein
MTRYLRIFAAPLFVALILPATAAARPVSGTVLQTNPAHHVIRIVEGPGKVESFYYKGKLGAGVRPGSLVKLNANGHRATGIHARYRPHRVQVLGRVVKAASSGLTVSLPDGRLFQVKGGGGTRSARTLAHAAGNVSVNVLGLQPGQLIKITIDYQANGDMAITIELMPSSEPPSDNPGDENPGDNSGQPDCAGPDAADGKVLGINRDNGTFTIGQPWNDESVYKASAEVLAHIHEGDQVLVRFTPDDPSTATDARIISSKVAAADPDVKVADGTVNRVNLTAAQFTVIQSNRTGALTLNGACWILDRVWTSEDVHVIYHVAPSGDLVADTVDANDGSEFLSHS